MKNLLPRTADSIAKVTICFRFLPLVGHIEADESLDADEFRPIWALWGDISAVAWSVAVTFYKLLTVAVVVVS